MTSRLAIKTLHISIKMKEDGADSHCGAFPSSQTVHGSRKEPCPIFSSAVKKRCMVHTSKRTEQIASAELGPARKPCAIRTKHCKTRSRAVETSHNSNMKEDGADSISGALSSSQTSHNLIKPRIFFFRAAKNFRIIQIWRRTGQRASAEPFLARRPFIIREKLAWLFLGQFFHNSQMQEDGAEPLRSFP